MHHFGTDDFGTHHCGTHHCGMHHFGTDDFGMHHFGMHRFGMHHFGMHHFGTDDFETARSAGIRSHCTGPCSQSPPGSAFALRSSERHASPERRTGDGARPGAAPRSACRFSW